MVEFNLKRRITNRTFFTLRFNIKKVSKSRDAKLFYRMILNNEGLMDIIRLYEPTNFKNFVIYWLLKRRILGILRMLVKRANYRSRKMKTGIITFHRAINYGAVLQTYALQEYLNDHGYNAEVIDYRCDHMENFYKIASIKDKSIKQIIRGLMNFGYAYKKKHAFYRFLKQNVNMSSENYEANEY